MWLCLGKELKTHLHDVGINWRNMETEMLTGIKHYAARDSGMTLAEDWGQSWAKTTIEEMATRTAN